MEQAVTPCRKGQSGEKGAFKSPLCSYLGFNGGPYWWNVALHIMSTWHKIKKEVINKSPGGRSVRSGAPQARVVLLWPAPVGFFCFSFPRRLRGKRRLLIWNVSFFFFFFLYIWYHTYPSQLNASQPCPTDRIVLFSFRSVYLLFPLKLPFGLIDYLKRCYSISECLEVFLLSVIDFQFDSIVAREHILHYFLVNPFKFLRFFFFVWSRIWSVLMSFRGTLEKMCFLLSLSGVFCNCQ